jgi:hypothetical protein
MLLKSVRRYIFLAVVFAATTAFCQGQVSIESRVDRAKIYIGDVVKYTVVLTHDADVKLERPSPGKNLGQFEIREYSVQEPKKVGNQVVSQTDYFISTFDVGDFEIPSLLIFYRLAQDTTLRQLRTEVIKIQVVSLNPNEKGDIRDIKPPMTPPRDVVRIILMVCVALIVLALCGLGYWYYQRRKRGESILPVREKPKRPAHELALEALADLAQSDLLATGQVKIFYIRVSEILRQYVEGRYFIDAMEMTTLQLVSRMKTDQVPQEHISALQAILQLSDLVKFAKFVPPEELQRQAVPQAIAFVDRTKLILVEATVTPSADEPPAPVPAAAEKEA